VNPPTRGPLLGSGGVAGVTTTGSRHVPGEPGDVDEVGDGRRQLEPDGARGPSEATGRFGYHAALDGLRGAAVLAVIAYHDNYRWARGGFLGVDIFFVLSGFLITTLLVIEARRAGSIAFASFWARRARRLLPALLVVLCFVAAFNRIAVVPWQRLSIRADMLASLFYVANWRFIADAQSYFQLFSAASPLRHMWSLAIEEQYYLVWPLVVFACMRLAKRSLRVLGAVCAIGALASIYAMQARYEIGNPSAAYYATDARAHSLLIGGLLAVLLVGRRPPAVLRRLLACAGVLAAVAILVELYTMSGTAPGYYRGGSAVFAVLSAIVIAGALQPGALASILSVRPLVWIGKISYGLYLWHWPIDVWLVRSRVALGHNELNALRLGATFVVATISYYVVERPVRERLRRPRWTAAAFVPAVASVAVVTMVGAAGAAPLPGYIWGYGDPLICGSPRPNETAEAVEAARAHPLPPLPDSARRERILLVGDSTACSLWPGLHAVGDAAGIATDQGSVFGCGVASDEITTTRNEAITPHSSRCHGMVDETVSKALARARPTIVLWMSIWEKSDLVVGDHVAIAGTPEGEAEIMARMDDALARLTAGGARVVMVTEPAPAPNAAEGTQNIDKAADDAGYARLNDLLHRFATRHPDKVTVVDLATKVCPGGPPCPERVDGMVLRPDGHHFTPTAATWAAEYVLTQIFHG